ncbi:MAG: GDSL-type esterase/lipase family protein [Hydrogenovibrio sp.]|uniref:GDSL-type esterase/lipase family protein n=1 Tax=Hydrogenovibrio sp. TaxID=2065821 RepID=UPI00286FF382|nr:GDSL-type esterase/lipase family protein [Hydrogenovibrio sp.]MDR9498836.1 GDSL-type esterase/lipase family protein [Hydrogenovibrio sp.]
MPMDATALRICFIGDSFVNGTGDEKMLGWAGRLCVQASQLGHDLTYYNLGIRGHTSTDILQRWDEVALRLPVGYDARIVLSCGVNDTMIEGAAPHVDFDVSVQNFRELFGKMQNLPGLVVGPPPVNDPAQNQRILTLSNAMQVEADKAGLPFVPLFDALIIDQTYLNEIAGNDGAHPQASGYNKMAELIQQSGQWWFS